MMKKLLPVVIMVLCLDWGCKKAETRVMPVYLPTGFKDIINGVTTDSTIYRYDAQDRITEIVNNFKKTSTRIIYNGDGHLTEADLLSNGVVTAKHLYTYAAGTGDRPVY
jgi:YD repeat-containing protein